MNVIAEYLDDAKRKLGIESDNQLAKILKINRSRVSLYRSGSRKDMELQTRCQLAEILGLDPMAVAARIEEQNARTAEKKAWWKNFSQRHRSAVGALALCGAGLMALLTNDGPTWAESPNSFVKSVYYVKSEPV